MNTHLLVVSAFLATTLAALSAPRIVVSTPSLVPESRMELVFDSPVTRTEDLGTTTANTWLTIKPNLDVKLRWQSPNVAQLVTEDPLAIATAYAFSIPEGKTHLDGSPVPSGKITTLETEPLRLMTSFSPERWKSDYSPCTTSWIIAFNDEIDPKVVPRFAVFASKEGQRIAAQVRFATAKEGGYHTATMRPWAKRATPLPEAELPPDAPLANFLMIQPLSPLPPGENWKLWILKGMPNATASARFPDDLSFDIGTIHPFTVKSIQPIVEADEPRAITIQFNHAPPQPLPDDFLAATLTITPRPDNLTATVIDQTIRLTGSLTNADKYQLTVLPRLKSATGLPLTASHSANIEFKHLTPNVSLPSENSGQLASGQRKYRLYTRNLEHLQVRAKLLQGLDLVRAFQGYRHVSGNGPNGESIQPTAPIPYPLVVGTTVMDRTFDLGNPIDTTKVITLSWNEILPAATRSAVLFLEASGKPHALTKNPHHQSAQSIVQITDIGLAWKLTSGQALVYAFSCETGKPLSDVKLQLYGEDAATLASTTTNSSGLAKLPRQTAARHLLASLAEDKFITAFDSTMETVGLWHFPVRYSWITPPESQRTVMLFTDRPLYQPGETVHIKGIIRMLRGNTIEAVSPGAARLVIADPTSRDIATHEVMVSANGSFDFSHKLGPTTTGTHLVRLEFPDDLAKLPAENAPDTETDWYECERIRRNAIFRLPLRVEEFRRNAFEIKQELATPAVAATSITANLEADYYQGQPVAAGKVKYYSRIKSGNLYPERFRDFLFGNHRSYDHNYWYHYFDARSEDGESPGHSSNLEGETSLSQDGRARISVDLPQGDFPTGWDVTVSSEITDTNHQTLTSSSSIRVHPASVYVGISRIDRLIRAKEAVDLKIVATDTEGNPFTKPLTLTATLTRQVNSSIRTLTEDGATATRNDVTEEPVLTSTIELDPARSLSYEGQLLTITPQSTGLHFLTLRGNDPEGHAFATTIHFHAYGTDEYPWLYEDGLRVKLISEKKSYQPTDTARILVLTPIEGTALVTVEREKVLRSFLTTLKSDNPVIEVPLVDRDAPNVFVSVLIVKGAGESAREFKQPQLRLGYCELLVENQRDRLAVEVVPPPNTPRPGDDITIAGSVRSATGQPVSNAEVTLYAEDEGTLAVTGYTTPSPMAHFYQPRLLSVTSGVSFDSFIAEDPEMQSFSNKGFFVGGGGEPEDAATANMRRNFTPCATWAPVLMTDAKGTFSHSFKLPDTLTRYRIIAIAHEGATRFGHSETHMVVKKDLMLEPKTPRFANQSDLVNAQVLVQNTSAYHGTWRIDFNSHASSGTPVCRAPGSITETVNLAAGASTTLVFPVLAEHTGTAVLAWKATPVSLSNDELTEPLSRQLSDAVESRFTVHYPVPLLHQVKMSRVEPNGAATDIRAMLDENLLQGTGTIELALARSPLVEAADSVDFLLRYPYGCLEQTTSSLIPWCLVDELKDSIPAFSHVSEDQVHTALQAGADRLLGMQRPDGSFSYWPDSTESADWATPYAGLGLIMAASSGANVPQPAIESLVQYLTGTLRGLADTRSASELENHSRTLFVLATAGKPQESYQNAMADRIGRLSPAARCWLAAAIALQANDNPAASAAARKVLTSKVAFQPIDDDRWMNHSPDAALRLLAWALIDPEGPETLQALDRLLNERNPYGYWPTTWVNGWSLTAIAQYARHDKSRGATPMVELETDQGTENIKLSPESPTASRTFTLSPNLKLLLRSDQGASVRARISSKPPVVPLQPVSCNGMAVTRTYQLIKPDGSASPLAEPNVGDLIQVSLRVTLPNDDTRYLIVDDPLPAIFETVNSSFKTQSSALGVSTSEQDWNISHSELRSDRALFFLDHIDRNGTYTIRYLARCTLSGTATAPPAKVEGMYDPENMALSASRAFHAR